MKIHAVLENGHQVVYLGHRVTDEPDPAALANVGHVTALLRGTRALTSGHVVVNLEGRRPRRWRLHRDTPGTAPVITELLARRR